MACRSNSAYRVLYFPKLYFGKGQGRPADGMPTACSLPNQLAFDKNITRLPANIGNCELARGHAAVQFVEDRRESQWRVSGPLHQVARFPPNSRREIYIGCSPVA
jgi:hypothetical protein